MADTSVYYQQGVETVPYDSLSDSLKLLVNQARQSYLEHGPKTTWAQESYIPFLLVMAVFIIVAYISIKYAWKSKGIHIHGDSHNYLSPTQATMDALEKEYLVYPGHTLRISDAEIETIVAKRNPYFRKLAPELKEEFLERTKKFLRSKFFLLKTNEPFIDMPVLISATAVQISFGLQQYLLPHYEYIRVFKEEYFAHGTTRVLAGHVYGNTITLAWNHFLEGYENQTDGSNVGLHEMAHALYYQHIEADVIRSASFVDNYHELMAEGREVLEEKAANPSALFSANAYTSLQEFWAESVELFFERPGALKKENSELYNGLCNILNQDPQNELYPVTTA